MANQMSEALKSAKTINTELVQIENRVAFETNKYNDLKKQNEMLSGEIDQKRTEYELFMGSRDAETKKLRNDLLADRQKFEAEKAEFIKILQDLNSQKNKLESDKSTFTNEKSAHEQGVDNLRQCIIAIQRAVTLIGL